LRRRPSSRMESSAIAVVGFGGIALPSPLAAKIFSL
jgi:hypothetical protein